MAIRKARSKRKSSPKTAPRAARGPLADILNPGLQWRAYKSIEKQIKTAWNKLQYDVDRGAALSVLLEDRNRLMLLLGECNYMAREWMNWADYPLKKWK